MCGRLYDPDRCEPPVPWSLLYYCASVRRRYAASTELAALIPFVLDKYLVVGTVQVSLHMHAPLFWKADVRGSDRVVPHANSIPIYDELTLLHHP